MKVSRSIVVFAKMVPTFNIVGWRGVFGPSGGLLGRRPAAQLDVCVSHIVTVSPHVRFRLWFGIVGKQNRSVEGGDVSMCA